MSIRLKHIALWVVLLFSGSELFAQIATDSTTRKAPIFYDVLGNEIDFRAKMPPLRQISGAPKAYYTYYWEFGDGEYSFEQSPKHTYRKKGTYTVRLWSTNNYDSGKPPSSRPQKVSINTDLSKATSAINANCPHVFPDGEDLVVQTNRDPLPGQEMVLITSYKNTSNHAVSGVLYLFYNDDKFKDDNFILKETRLYHGEKIVKDETGYIAHVKKQKPEIRLAAQRNDIYIFPILTKDSIEQLDLPLVLEKSKEAYRNHQIIAFNDLQPGEIRHVFRTLETTPEMLKDTSAIITLRSIYVPDRNYGNYSVKDTELEIVTSHDPNKMSSTGTYMSYRFVRHKKIKFRVKFQNNGEGPAHTIRLEVGTPEMFDKSSLEVLKMYPECPICPEGKQVTYSCLDTTTTVDKIIFTFKNIYLPGSRQKGVTSRDSTKGFVKYRLSFGDQLNKVKTKSRTAIYFDENPPIYTNYSTTWFRPGISFGAKAGYIYTPSRTHSREFFAGVTVSPFKPHHGYLQAEFFLSSGSFENLKSFTETQVNAIDITKLTRYHKNSQTRHITAYLVPASYRYNINDFLSFGSGIQLKMDLQQKIKTQTIGKAYLKTPGIEEIRNPSEDSFQKEKCTHYFTNFDAGLFLDVSAGSVRIGPSAGFRCAYNFRQSETQLQIYAVWKF